MYDYDDLDPTPADYCWECTAAPCGATSEGEREYHAAFWDRVDPPDPY